MTVHGDAAFRRTLLGFVGDMAGDRSQSSGISLATRIRRRDESRVKALFPLLFRLGASMEYVSPWCLLARPQLGSPLSTLRWDFACETGVLDCLHIVIT